MKSNNIIIKQGRVTRPWVCKFIDAGTDYSRNLCLISSSLVFFTQSNEKTKPSEESMQLSLLNLRNNNY